MKVHLFPSFVFMCFLWLIFEETLSMLYNR